MDLSAPSPCPHLVARAPGTEGALGRSGPSHVARLIPSSLMAMLSLNLSLCNYVFPLPRAQPGQMPYTFSMLQEVSPSRALAEVSLK